MKNFVRILIFAAVLGFIVIAIVYSSPAQVGEYLIIGNREVYIVEHFTEEDGCVIFNGYQDKITKICGTYTIKRY